MQRSEFIDLMKEAAEQHGKVVIHEVAKASGHYLGMRIELDGVPVPVVNLDMLYERYLETDDIEECTDFIHELLGKEIETPCDMTALADWEVAKKLLFLRMFGNVVDGVCRCVADIYQVPYLQLADDGSAVAQVTPQLLDTWGISVDEVFAQAERNQESLRPAVVLNLSALLDGDEGNPLYIVTTSNRAYGASAILYNGVADRLRDALGGDFYIIPASIHEMLVFAKLDEDDIPFYTRLISMINREELADHDVLSNSLYTYDFEKRSIKKAV